MRPSPYREFKEEDNARERRPHKTALLKRDFQIFTRASAESSSRSTCCQSVPAQRRWKLKSQTSHRTWPTTALPSVFFDNLIAIHCISALCSAGGREGGMLCCSCCWWMDNNNTTQHLYLIVGGGVVIIIVVLTLNEKKN